MPLLQGIFPTGTELAKVQNRAEGQRKTSFTNLSMELAIKICEEKKTASGVELLRKLG